MLYVVIPGDFWCDDGLVAKGGDIKEETKEVHVEQEIMSLCLQTALVLMGCVTLPFRLRMRNYWNSCRLSSKGSS